ncbi:acyltransferase [Sphingobium sp. LMC3-1-1.1]|uniref:acyltransferase family protein n=1 Tax=Sphingobium sp. LMC3-1-1.1 TaxID=3135241 RepID=UPI0034169132
MPKGFSSYLDGFRFIAAVIVLVYHAMRPEMGYSGVGIPYGPDAVMAFFVLSGFVIAFVAGTKEASPADFISSRLSRLWTVLLPAVFIVPIIDFIGMTATSAPYSFSSVPMGFSHPLFRMLLSATFTGEAWFWSYSLLSDGPIWSLHFEFFYYLLFTIYLFSAGYWRWTFIGITVLLFGPKMLLVMPVWIGGVLLYRLRHFLPHSLWLGAALMVVGADAIIVGHWIGLDRFWPDFLHSSPLGRSIALKLKFAANFPWMNYVGICVVVHLAGAYMVFGQAQAVPSILRRALRGLANGSFAIYLFHYPLQFMIAARLWYMQSDVDRLLLVISGSLCISFLIGLWVERLRRPLTLSINSVLRWISARVPRLFTPHRKANTFPNVGSIILPRHTP